MNLYQCAKEHGLFYCMKEFIHAHPLGRWFTNFLLIIALVVGVALLDHRNSERDYKLRLAFCRDQETIRSYARATANRSLNTLPTIQYYKTHPRELQEALKLTREQRQFFSPPRDCKKFAKELST